MKKIIVLLMFSILAFADFPKMEALLIQQSTIATGVDAYIKNRGSIPSSIDVLKSAGYIPSDFNASNPVDGDNITFSVSNQQIFINSEVETSKVDSGQIDYYINTTAYRDLGRVSKVESLKLVSYYTLSDISSLNLNLDSLFGTNVFKGNSDPTLYTAVATGNYWFSSTFTDDMYQTYVRDTNWRYIDSFSQNFNPITKAFVNTNLIPLTKSYWDKQKVIVTSLNDIVKCNNGEIYNAVDDRCEAYTSNACDMANGYYYNSSTKMCTKISYTSKVATTKTVKIVDKYGYYYRYDTESSVFETTGTESSTSNLTFSFCINDMEHGGRYWYYAGTFVDSTGQMIFLSNTNIGGILFRCPTYEELNSYSSTSHKIVEPNNYTYFHTTVNSDLGKITNITSFKTLTTTTYACPAGYTDNGSNCVKVKTESPTCAGKKMPVSPYYDTPYYGNNGVCYSDAGLYCKNTGVSWDGIYTCYDHSEHCADTTWNLNYTSDLCEKFTYSCNIVGYHRYGLSESPTNSDATDLYNRIANPDDKFNLIPSAIIAGDVTVDDNKGAMCVDLRYSDFSQPTVSPTYTINGEAVSGF